MRNPDMIPPVPHPQEDGEDLVRIALGECERGIHDAEPSVLVDEDGHYVLECSLCGAFL